MTGWELLPRIVLLLAAAVVCGLALRYLRQSVIVGYLIAGVILGPTVFGLVGSGDDFQILSELGVALLMFSIGLEFSFKRLQEFGRVAVGSGLVQIGGTILLVTSAAIIWGLSWPEALAIGMAFAMSSTAVVLRGLTDRAELDSSHGRSAVGILLLQDLAVVPVLIATDALSHQRGATGIAEQVGLRAGVVVLFMLGAWVVARLVLPRVLSSAALSGSRELPVVIAICTSIGAAWGAHAFGFSPSLGAFIAGLLLGESPFATQIRADVTPLTAVFITLFFASVGTAVSLPPSAWYLGAILLAALTVMASKTVITAISVWLFRRSFRVALVTGLVISQVGEFTFVIADSAYRAGVIGPAVFQFTLGVSLITLILTPYAMGVAPGFATRLMRRAPAGWRGALEQKDAPKPWRRVIIIGFGPAGQQVVERVAASGIGFLVLDMNPNTVAANRSTIAIELGDATQREVLQHVGVGQSLAVVITIPDPAAARMISQNAQRLAPGVPIVARSRYHQYFDSLKAAGADIVVDEEEVVGAHLAHEALEACRHPQLSPQPASE